MKKIFTLFLVALAIIAVNSGKINAQVNEQFKLSSIDPYFSGYIEPFGKAMSIGLSGGWTHTAKVHSTLGFDITFSASIVKIPVADKTFESSAIDIAPFGISGTVPTLSAKKDDFAAPTLSRSISIDPGTGTPVTSTFEFDGLTGMGVGIGGMAALQAGVGLPKGTEVMVRFIPNLANMVNSKIPTDTDFELSKTGMWGLGVKHDIKQWIPVVSKVPFLQISGMVTYSRFYTGMAGTDMRLTPEKLNATDNVGAAADWTSQKFDIKMSSLTGSLLIGANIPVFQPFIGIGFNSAKFGGGFLGDYPVIDFELSDDKSSIEYAVNEFEKDPITLETKTTNFNFQAGARLKLGPIVFFYVMTSQKYMMHSGGLAVTIR